MALAEVEPPSNWRGAAAAGLAEGGMLAWRGWLALDFFLKKVFFFWIFSYNLLNFFLIFWGFLTGGRHAGRPEGEGVWEAGCYSGSMHPILSGSVHT